VDAQDTLASVATHDFYEAHAVEYAKATLQAPMERLLHAFTARLRPGDLVLDAGCGAGRDLAWLSTHGFRAIGLDYAVPLAHYAQKHSGQQVVIGDIRQMPFANKSFNGVWAAASLLHLARRELPLALREVRRVLQPGGWLFASVKAGSGEGFSSDGRWFTYYSKAEWRTALHSAGFVDIDVGEDVEERRLTDCTTRVTWLTSFSRQTH
jgi:ubiquinone/menaquinone biosynthesis C-methylase UbiE